MQFLGLTAIHRAVTLTQSGQRCLADTQDAAGLSCAHSLASRLLSLVQVRNDLVRSVHRGLPHGHPCCPALHGQYNSELLSQ